ncbi:Sodium/proline symporter [Bremerella volcania]|uniref:Sodium/proline symporter n=1 Tax=Bremerella volcania TaxID=2527984 RepID=A0A518C887_9BACT|nr:sodium:solute symporter family protein [Bremerella volcania]QDU75422.1 Sodium/proline symporter [Bremerella volcania]
MEIESSLRWLLAVTMVLYLVGMYVIGVIAQRKVHNAEDFLVAGRKLPLSFAWMTLLATWFGAGTMLTAADEVRSDGLTRAALDPFGAGFCLLIAGLFVAGPMWRMQLLTVPDFFRRKFGSSAEMISSLILIPSYFGWIAAQFTALAEVLLLFFGIPLIWGILIVAIVGTGYTLMGGMWSVTLTDAVQISLVLVGLLVLGGVVLFELGQGNMLVGLTRVREETDPEMWTIIPADSAASLAGWIGVFAIGALGNLPGQDLMQRVFAANSERTAKWACLVAGVLYLLFGAIPLLLALAGNILFPEDMETKILPALAHAFLHPVVAVIFLVALLSAILSTIDSAILSPASVMAQNVFPRLGWADTLRSNRIAILMVAVCSLLLSYAGESAYALLEEAYLLTMVGLFVPLIVGLYTSPCNSTAAIVSMLVGTGIWAVHFALGWETFLPLTRPLAAMQLPISLSATACALVAYFCVQWPWRTRFQSAGSEAREEGATTDEHG